MRRKVMAMVMAAMTMAAAMAVPAMADEESVTIGISQFAEHGSLDNCREGFLEGLKEAGYESENKEIIHTDILSFQDLKEIVEIGVEKYLNKEVGGVDIIYTQFINTMTFEAEVDTLLPFSVKKEKKEEHISCFHDLKELPETAKKRVMTTGGHYAFLKIAEGCDKRCSYCIIPYLRGPYRSVPMEQLLAEARELAENGVRELILVAQETTLYGKDLYGEKTLPKLLHELAQIPGIYWIRIQYCYPEEITDELIQAIKTEEKVCHYLDIPIQHASDRILKRMGRRTHKAELKERIGALRREIPDIALRTTFICGFPGETEEDHEELMEFVDEMEFERVGVFTYSAEEDTPAYSYPDQIPEEVKEERRADVMELQQEIAFEHCENMVGKVLDVMIEGKVADEPAYVGRTYMDAPNVDGLIFVNADEMLMSGDFVRVKVTGANEFDLIGEVYHESAE